MATPMELKDIILETINTLENQADTSLESQQKTTKDSHFTQNTEPKRAREMSESHTHGQERAHSLLQSQAPYERENLSTMFEQNHTRTNLDEKIPPNPKARLKPSMVSVINESHNKQALSDEKTFLKLLQDRLLVLFEGLSMPDKDSQKLTMVLNFLQYQLSVIAKRLENLEDKK